jgi:phosphoglycerate dehydrogenase-like enzyme
VGAQKREHGEGRRRPPACPIRRPHYAPGLEWSAYQPLLPDWEIVAGDPTAGALDGVDVLVAAAADAELIAAGAFGLIQQIGTGTDRIDTDAATKAGVWVSSLPSGLTGNADGVADTAVLLTLAALRRLDESRRALADGRWAEPAGRTLDGRTVVVVGLGDVGERVVARLGGFGARLVGVRARPERGGLPGLDRVEQGRTRWPRSRPRPTRSSCAPASKRARRPLLDGRVLRAARAGLVVVNVARGGLIDEAALPHVAGVTEDMFRRAGPELAGELERWRSDRAPLHAVNRPPSPRGLYSRRLYESRHAA